MSKYNMITVTFVDFYANGPKPKKTQYSAMSLEELLVELENKLNLEKEDIFDFNPYNENREQFEHRQTQYKLDRLRKAKWIALDPYAYEIGEGRRQLLYATTLTQLKEIHREAAMSI